MRRVLVLLAAAIVGLSGAIKSLHIYGEPSDAFVEQMKQAANTLIVKSKYSLGSTASRQRQRLNRQVESRRDFPGPEF